MSSQISSSVSAIAAKEGMILMLSYKTFLSWFDTSLSFSLERNGTAIGLSKGFLAFASALDTWEWSLLARRKSVVASEVPDWPSSFFFFEEVEEEEACVLLSLSSLSRRANSAASCPPPSFKLGTVGAPVTGESGVCMSKLYSTPGLSSDDFELFKLPASSSIFFFFLKKKLLQVVAPTNR